MPIGYFLIGAYFFLPIYFGLVSDIARDRVWKVGAVWTLAPFVVSLAFLLFLLIDCGSSCVQNGVVYFLLTMLGGLPILYGVGILIRATYMATRSPK